MKSNSRNAAARLFLLALIVGSSVDARSAVRDSLPAASDPNPSHRPSPPIAAFGEIDAVRGGEGATRLLAQANAADAANAGQPPAKSPEERTPEEKKRVKTAVVLLSVLSGIALSGLLMIIAAVSIRGLQRKLSGPTRLDREPADLFPPPRPEPDLPPAVESTTPADSSSQETRLT